jgi:alpha-beta hydrolase superfamily lysophospholipase
MLAEGTGLTTTYGGVTRMAINFGKYVHGMVYFSTSLARLAASSGSQLPGVVWLHPYSYQSGFVENYPRDSERAFDALAKAGFVVLTYDQAAFGQRLLEKTNFYRRAANRQWSLLGELVQDASSALDALASSHDGPFPDGLPLSDIYDGKWYPAVNASQVYVAGYGLGGIVASYAAALDQRFAGAVALSALTPLRNDTLAWRMGGNQRLYRWHALQPRLGWFQDEAHLEAAWPYDYDDVLAMIAPRPALVAVQELDRMCNIDGLRPLLTKAAQAHASLSVEYHKNKTNILDDDLVGSAVRWLKEQLVARK